MEELDSIKIEPQEVGYLITMLKCEIKRVKKEEKDEFVRDTILDLILLPLNKKLKEVDKSYK